MPHDINTQVLTEKNPCFNKAIHVVFMIRYGALTMRVHSRHAKHARLFNDAEVWQLVSVGRIEHNYRKQVRM